MHEHVGKVSGWGFDSGMSWTANRWGCTGCDESFDSIPTSSSPVKGHFHTSFMDNCFACKISTLQINAGDASSTRIDSMPQRKWDRELQSYRDARDQGVQPEGTTTAKIESAMRASDKLGRAYDARSMMPAVKVSESAANLMNEAGI